MATSALGVQNWYETTLSSGISSSDTTISVNNVPTPSEGYLVIEPDSATNREVIYYTSKTASAVVLSSTAGRGVDGTSAISHSSGSTVRMVLTKSIIDSLQDTTALGSNYTQSWIPGSGTWTYISATTFSVPSADAASMTVGSKIKFTQTSSKYFYVTGVSGTTITVTGGSDYTVANAAITSPYYSNAASPQGFPQWFNATQTFGGFSANPTSVYRFCIVGRKVSLILSRSANGTSNATTFTIAAPVTSATVANHRWTTTCACVDSGASATYPGLVILGSNSTNIQLFKDNNGAVWTGSGAKSAEFELEYEI